MAWGQCWLHIHVDCPFTTFVEGAYGLRSPQQRCLWLPPWPAKPTQGVGAGNTIVPPPEPRARGACGIMGMPRASGHLKGDGKGEDQREIWVHPVCSSPETLWHPLSRDFAQTYPSQEYPGLSSELEQTPNYAFKPSLMPTLSSLTSLSVFHSPLNIRPLNVYRLFWVYWGHTSTNPTCP